MVKRVAAFIDGFNLYHAIKDLKVQHLKWLNLRKLCENFTPSPQYELIAVYYFSAYATWRPHALVNHREYVKALQKEGVVVIMGNFKEKDRRCFICKARRKDHEEKETDVNIALQLLDGAYQDLYDQALIVSADSDLAPAVRMVVSRFPNKSIRLITPVGRNHSSELLRAVGGAANATAIKRIHLERSLFPEIIYDKDGVSIIVQRPIKYLPPH